MVTSEPQEQASRARQVLIIVVVMLVVILVTVPSILSVNEPGPEPSGRATTPLSH